MVFILYYSCEKESRCTVEKSNGTFDNKCGPVVSGELPLSNATKNKVQIPITPHFYDLWVGHYMKLFLAPTP